ncbi:MAG: hypothetical protein L0Z51_12475 [Candidatus Latescibacteria bacterium]|nr:hypothetical protein [Candidatus Latescibacterota bacterium]
MRFFVTTLAFCVISAAAAETSTTQSDGLSVTFRLDTTTVTMGAAVDFHVSLVFDTSMADTKTRILNRHSESCEFVFVNDRTGESFERLPYNTGMLAMEQPGNLVRLTHGARFVLDDLKVHLLNDEGEQIPPGTYSVRVTYVNDGGDRTEAHMDSTHQYRRRRYEGPWEVWSGQAVSTSSELRILPASPALVEVVIPSALVVDTTTVRIPSPEGWSVSRGMQVAWAFSADSTQVIRVMKQPGFALGIRWRLESLVDGKTISDFPQGLEGLPVAGGQSYLHPHVSSQLSAATDSELILHMEVFEASNQPKHAWMPERGEFRVLWTGQIRYRLRGGRR